MNKDGELNYWKKLRACPAAASKDTDSETEGWKIHGDITEMLMLLLLLLMMVMVMMWW